MMKTLSQGFGIEKVHTLVDVAHPSIMGETTPSTIKETPESSRVPYDELELAYTKQPIVFNSVNNIVQAIMMAGWEIRADDEKTLLFFKEFTENIGIAGEKVTFHEVLESLFKHQIIYGNAYLENVLGKNTKSLNNIVDLVILDPKRMDFAKRDDSKIVFDEFGNPSGYTQSWPFGVDTTDKGDSIPEGSEINLEDNQIFLIPARISHLKMNSYGERLYGLGLIEPGYKSVNAELKIKKTHNNAIDQKADGPIVDYVGDTFHEPTPQQIEDALGNMQNIKSNRYLAVPYWHRLESLNIKPNNVVKDHLLYLRQDISASLGMPLAFAANIGETTNKSTLSSQQLFMLLTLNDLVKKTIEYVKKFIFRRICEFHKLPEVPEIVWGHISVDEINEKSKRLTSYVDKEIIKPEEARPYVLESERLQTVADNPLDSNKKDRKKEDSR